MGKSNMIICPQCKKYIIGYNSYFGSYFCNKCGYWGDGEMKEKEDKLKLIQSSQCDIPFEREVNEVLWNYTMILKSKWEIFLAIMDMIMRTIFLWYALIIGDLMMNRMLKMNIISYISLVVLSYSGTNIL